MNVSLTIPQLFYDFVARVAPGFFFLLGLQLVFGARLVEFLALPARGNWLDSAFVGFAVLGACYLIGWMLSAGLPPNPTSMLTSTFSFVFQLLDSLFTKRSATDRKEPAEEEAWERQVTETENRPERDDPTRWKTHEKHDWIRLHNPACGFRLLKLRAEARMLACNRRIGFVLLIIAAQARAAGIGTPARLVICASSFAVLMISSDLLITRLSTKYRDSVEWHFTLLTGGQPECKVKSDPAG